jgi:hypothetical protein
MSFLSGFCTFFTKLSTILWISACYHATFTNSHDLFSSSRHITTIYHTFTCYNDVSKLSTPVEKLSTYSHSSERYINDTIRLILPLLHTFFTSISLFGKLSTALWITFPHYPQGKQPIIQLSTRRVDNFSTSIYIILRALFSYPHVWITFPHIHTCLSPMNMLCHSYI